MTAVWNFTVTQASHRCTYKWQKTTFKRDTHDHVFCSPIPIEKYCLLSSIEYNQIRQTRSDVVTQTSPTVLRSPLTHLLCYNLITIQSQQLLLFSLILSLAHHGTLPGSGGWWKFWTCLWVIICRCVIESWSYEVTCHSLGVYSVCPPVSAVMSAKRRKTHLILQQIPMRGSYVQCCKIIMTIIYKDAYMVLCSLLDMFKMALHVNDLQETGKHKFIHVAEKPVGVLLWRVTKSGTSYTPAVSPALQAPVWGTWPRERQREISQPPVEAAVDGEAQTLSEGKYRS